MVSRSANLLFFLTTLLSFASLIDAKTIPHEARVLWEGSLVENLPENVTLVVPLEPPITLKLRLLRVQTGCAVRVVSTRHGTNLTDTEAPSEKEGLYLEESRNSTFKLKAGEDGVEYFGEFSSEGARYHLLGDLLTTNHTVVAVFNIDSVQHVVLKETIPSISYQEDVEVKLRPRMAEVTTAENTPLPKQKLSLQVLAVVDYYLYTEWLKHQGGNDCRAVSKIKQYLKVVFEEVSSIYEAIESDRFSLSVGLAGIYILKNNTESLYDHYPPEGGSKKDLLVEFNGWIEGVKKRFAGRIPAHAASFFFTGPQSGLVGRSFVGRACKSYSSSVVKDTSFFSTITVTAHELAHLLGIQHDDLESNGCRFIDGFLMASYHGPKAGNVWKFSNCSLLFLHTFLQHLNLQRQNCLIDFSEVHLSASTSWHTSPTRFLSLDAQCRQATNKDTLFCAEGLLSGNFCRELVCRDANSSVCRHRTQQELFDGTPCGRRKECVAGKCLPSKQAPSKDETRPLPLPTEMVLELQLATLVRLDLRKTATLNESAVPVVTTRKSKWRSKEQREISLYESVENAAFFSVEQVVKNGKISRKYFGSFWHENKAYSVLPTNENSGKGRKKKDFQVKLHGVNHVVFETDYQLNFGDEQLPTGIETKKGRSKQGRRRKRETSPIRDLVLELLVLVDYSVFRSWMDFHSNDTEASLSSIRLYYSHVVAGMDSIYKKIDSRKYNFSVVLTAIYVSETAEDSFTENSSIMSGGVLDYSASLAFLKDWAERKGGQLPHHDFIASFTKYSASGAVKGMAYVATMCTSKGLSINKDHGVYSTIAACVHEIGHNLGALHDGSNNTCSSADQFIMASARNEIILENFNKFSPCSISSFEDYLDSLGSSNCLLEEAGSRVNISGHTALNLGTIYTVTQQCHHVFGSDSYFCSRGKHTDTEKCRALPCYDPFKGSCMNTYDSKALDGTPCGKNKWCMEGSCVYDPDAPEAQDECLDGDYVGRLNLASGPITCADIRANRPLCRTAGIRDYCCETCRQLAIEDPDCPFGNRYSNCGDFVTQCRVDEIRRDCCESCAEFIAGNPPDCPYGNFYSNCDDFAYLCDSNDDIRDLCCITCA